MGVAVEMPLARDEHGLTITRAQNSACLTALGFVCHLFVAAQRLQSKGASQVAARILGKFAACPDF